MVDFSDIDHIRRTVEHCTRLPVPERHPYVGDLVHTAFSGTHQDAIKKGFAEHEARSQAAGMPADQLEWRVPYLPIDPADLGRDYAAVIRVNSQSGKGGIAYLLESEFGLVLPRRLQIDLARRVQEHTDGSGGEITASGVRAIFDAAYSPSDPALAFVGWASEQTGPGVESTRIRLMVDGQPLDQRVAASTGPVDALTQVLRGVGRPVEVLALTLQSVGRGSGADAVAYLEHSTASGPRWAVGVSSSTTGAALEAVIAAAHGSAAPLPQVGRGPASRPGIPFAVPVSSDDNRAL